MIAKTAAFLLYFQSVTTAGAANTSATPTVTLSGDGGAGAASTNAAAHVANGLWKVQLTASEMNVNVLGWTQAATGCVPSGGAVTTEADWTVARAGYLTGDAYARLGVPAGASVSADVAAVKSAVDVVDDYVDTEIAALIAAIAAVKAQTDKFTFTGSNVWGLVKSMDADVLDTGALRTDAADEIAGRTWSYAVDGLAAKVLLAVIASNASGDLAGAGTSTETLAAIGNGAQVRITATVDASGNRSVALTTAGI